MSSASASPDHNVIVLGGGGECKFSEAIRGKALHGYLNRSYLPNVPTVLGLTTALEVATSSRDQTSVHILSRDIPTSLEALTSQEWASPWAGFNWCSLAAKDDTVT